MTSTTKSRRRGKSILKTVAVLFGLAGGWVAAGLYDANPARADFPTPSVVPISWQLDFEHGTPTRIVVELPDQKLPQAYWYMTYSVTNHSGQEQLFLPDIEMLTADGQVIRSDHSIPNKVFDAIKTRERQMKFLEPWPKIAGEVRLGDDQARDSVAIWAEPMPRMATFNIFIAGLSGEVANVKDDKGETLKDDKSLPIVLRKTKQLTYHINGDEVKPGEDEVNAKGGEVWVMR